MKSGIGIRQSQKTALKQRVDPKIVLFSQVLQMASVELEQAVQSELDENPALERIDDEREPLSREEILRYLAPQELKASDENREAFRSRPVDDHSMDWLDYASTTDSLWDHLRGQILPLVPERLHTLALYVIGNVNDRGYLGCSPEEAAVDTNTTLEEATEVIELLRACEPCGVGAFDLRDCLILQLRTPANEAEHLARLILRNCWDDLVARNSRPIRSRYKVSEEAVHAAFEVITSLNPFPGEGFAAHSVPPSSERSVSAEPDVIVTLDAMGWIIEVPGPSPLHLRVHRAYEERYLDLNGKRSAPADERRHVTVFVERARQFLDALNSRRENLAKIARYLTEHQAGFMKTGDFRFLQPLTRADLAKAIGIHESTVSRATNGKFIQIATGEVIAFDVFFTPALRVQHMIEEILRYEHPDRPLSDKDIAEKLAAKGIKIARRTVNKYRDRRKLLSSHRRRIA